MTLCARDTVRVQVVFVIGFGIARDRSEILSEEQPVFAVGFALVVLGG
ncbi:Uncharacterised protein [Enterobacter cloacae]|nr:Uncharacterised protein [Enterobacter cloacae]